MIIHVQQFLIRDVDSYKRASQNFAQSLLQIIIVKGTNAHDVESVSQMLGKWLQDVLCIEEHVGEQFFPARKLGGEKVKTIKTSRWRKGTGQI